MAEDKAETAFSKLDSVGAILRAEFEQAKTDRLPYEMRWLMNLRMYKGEYEASVKARFDKNQTDAYIRLGRIKCNTMDARMFDMLFPAGLEKNWSIAATPKPALPDNVYNDIAQGIADSAQISIDQVPPEALEKAVKEFADYKAEKMTTAIEDVLTEGKYRRNGRKVIRSGNLFGTGWLKGTLTETSNDIEWTYDPDVDDYVAQPTEKTKAGFSFVSVWDVYPDLSAQSSDINLSDYIYQRHVMGKHHVQKLLKQPGFDKKAIKDYLRNHPQGDAKRAYHEEELRLISDDGKRTQTLRNKYEVLERYGYIDAEDLAACGCKDIEEGDTSNLFGVVWMLGNRVIKADIHPSDRAKHIFHKYHFEEDETSIFGFGVPDAIRDTQDLANSAIRAAVDNAGISAGPQVEVNVDLIDPAYLETANEVYPFKTWLRRGKGAEAQQKAVHVTNIDSHVAELIGLFNAFKTLNDEVSNIPSYMHGEGDRGAADTVGGLSMLMGAANITIKDVVANFDEGITVPFITSVYDWLMMFGPKEVKGDVAVKATGSSSLVAREVRARSLSQFQQDTANPSDAIYVNRYKILRESAKSLELPEDVLYPEEKSQEIMHQVQQMAAQMLAQAMAQAAQQDAQAGQQ